MNPRKFITKLSIIFLFVCSVAAVAQQFDTAAGPVRLEKFASGLEHPWALAFLPENRMLVTERPGRMRIVNQAGVVLPPLAGVPAVYAHGQGGLLDVVLDPEFSQNQKIYFSFAEPGEGGAGTAVARAVLVNNSLSEVAIIFRQQPKTEGENHWGSRLIFGRDGTLFITLGERYHARDQAQILRNHLGKIVRINRDGSVPTDNPFIKHPDARPEIWSYGHRNVQGAALHPTTGKLWEHEHGAQGGDELNIVEPGKNYGWPVITLGIDYSGAKIGIGTHKEGMEQPIYHWTPSIAPSGMTFYTGDRYPGWKGSLFIGALAKTHVARLELDGEKVTKEEKLFQTLGKRIRDVRQSPDGFLYLLTDSPQGEILKVVALAE